MKKRLHSRSYLFALVVFAATPHARAESLEDVEKKLSEAYTKLTSYVAKLQKVEDIPLAAGNYIKSDATGTVEWLRKGDKIFYRMEIAGRAEQKFDKSETRGEMTSTFVCDGELFYTLGEQLGVKRFVKQKRDDSINGDFRTMLKMVKTDNTVAVVDDGQVEGADCNVVEITPKIKPEDPEPVHKTLAYFRKDVGLVVRVASYNKEGKEVFSNFLSDLKINVPIDATRFVLQPPEGVEVTDLTYIEEPAGATPPP